MSVNYMLSLNMHGIALQPDSSVGLWRQEDVRRKQVVSKRVVGEMHILTPRQPNYHTFSPSLSLCAALLCFHMSPVLSTQPHTKYTQQAVCACVPARC